MKIREIISEEISAKEQLGHKSMSSNLVSVLMFLRKRSEDKELAPKLRTDSVIQMVQNTGDKTFNYGSFVAANENEPAIQNLIKNLNIDTVELTSSADIDDEEVTNDEPDQGGSPQDPQQVVDQMAKNASANRA